MSFVRTVVGDVSPASLGVTLSHEHLIIDSTIVERRWPHIHLPSTDEAVEELGECARSGVRSVVDAMPVGSGGDPHRLREISAATGVNIVASTGMHTAKYYQGVDWAFTESVDQLTRRFLADITNGIGGARTGVLKVATAGPSPARLESRLFEAAAAAHAETGVPVLTHCEGGTGGVAQMELLASLGIPAHHLALSHTDKVPDVGYHRDLLETGARLCYDQGLRDPEQTAGLVIDLVSLGFESQLLIGTDGARRSLWSTLGGGPGLAWINTGFRELLVSRGLLPAQLDQLFVANPARWLTFSG
jgi:phosphotriesterase-related protein